MEQKKINAESRSEAYVQDAIAAGFTRDQAMWLHNEFYDLKAI